VADLLRPRSARRPGDGGTDPPDDAALIARAIADPRAFAPLYNRYLDPIHDYCYRRLGSREVAEDATSLIFERALTALPRYRGGLFRAWLFTIAHNVITDSYRSTRIHEPLETLDTVTDPAPEPEAVALLADEHRLLLAALSMLPPEQRRVMELRLGGLPATEVAVVLGRTPESIRTLQLRAIRRLQRLLGSPAPTEVRHASAT
jgi:RNA polymerase sigma-70 factor, ECF subfamily